MSLVALLHEDEFTLPQARRTAILDGAHSQILKAHTRILPILVCTKFFVFLIYLASTVKGSYRVSKIMNIQCLHFALINLSAYTRSHICKTQKAAIVMWEGHCCML